MKDKDFFKQCFDTVAGLNVENESQAIAKEVVLNEIEDLEQALLEIKEYIEKKKDATPYVIRTDILDIVNKALLGDSNV